MTSDGDETVRGSYANRVTIVHRYVEDRGQPPLEEYEIVIDPYYGRIDLEWLNAEIENIHVDVDQTTGQRWQRVPYILTQRRNHHSWGADSTTIQFVVETLETIGTIGGTLVVEHGWQSLIDKLRARRHEVRHGKVEELSDDDAGMRACWLIESHYGIPFSGLTVKEVGNTPGDGTSTVTASGPDGSTYTVTFRVRGGETELVARKRTLRTLPGAEGTGSHT